MANLGNDVKTFFLKGVESLGKAASDLTVSARKKLDEINVAARRDEIRKALPDLLLQLWKNGAELPDELVSLLVELNRLNEQLAAAQAKPESAQPEEDTEEPTEEDEAEVEEADDSESEIAAEEAVSEADEGGEEENGDSGANG